MVGEQEAAGWRARALASMGYIGLVQCDFTQQKVRGDRQVGRLFGVDPDRMFQGVALDRLDAAFFPHDLELVKRSRLTPGPRSGPARYEYRLRSPEGDGGCTWIRSFAHLEVGRNGHLLQASGILFDATAHPPGAPRIHVGREDGDASGDAVRGASLADLDRLSGQLIEASRNARTMGLRGIEADLRLLVTRVGSLLSEAFRARSFH